jgi:hypothetical protein
MKCSYLTLIGVSHLALAACAVSMDLGDSGNIGNNDDLGDLGGGGSASGSIHDIPVDGIGHQLGASGETVDKDDSLINDVGGADTSQLDSASGETDQADLGLDSGGGGEQQPNPDKPEFGII